MALLALRPERAPLRQVDHAPEGALVMRTGMTGAARTPQKTELSDEGEEGQGQGSNRGLTRFALSPSPTSAEPPSTDRQTDAGAPEDKEDKKALSDAREDVEVLLYYGTWCRVCDAAISYMDEKQIPYSSLDIADPLAKEQLTQLNSRGGVPTFDIDGVVLAGFSPARFEAAMDAAAKKRLD